MGNCFSSESKESSTYDDSILSNDSISWHEIDDTLSAPPESPLPKAQCDHFFEPQGLSGTTSPPTSISNGIIRYNLAETLNSKFKLTLDELLKISYDLLDFLVEKHKGRYRKYKDLDAKNITFIRQHKSGISCITDLQVSKKLNDQGNVVKNSRQTKTSKAADIKKFIELITESFNIISKDNRFEVYQLYWYDLLLKFRKDEKKTTAFGLQKNVYFMNYFKKRDFICQLHDAFKNDSYQKDLNDNFTIKNYYNYVKLVCVKENKLKEQNNWINLFPENFQQFINNDTIPDNKHTKAKHDGKKLTQLLRFLRNKISHSEDLLKVFYENV